MDHLNMEQSERMQGQSSLCSIIYLYMKSKGIMEQKYQDVMAIVASSYVHDKLHVAEISD